MFLKELLKNLILKKKKSADDKKKDERFPSKELKFTVIPLLQLTEWSQENAMLKGKILTLTETMNNTELETKASRETIMRLVSEVGREKKDYERNVMEMDALRSVSGYQYPYLGLNRNFSIPYIILIFFH